MATEEGYTEEELKKIAAEKRKPKPYPTLSDAQIRGMLAGKEDAKRLSPELIELKKKREMEKIRDIAPQFANYRRTSDEVEGPGLLDQMKEYAKEKFPTLRSQKEVEERLQEKAKREGIGLTDSWRQDSRIKSRLDDYSARKEATDKMMDEEYNKRTLASVPLFPHQKERYKRRGQLEGIPLSELNANQAGEIQNKLERLKYQRHVLGIPYPGETFETGHMRNEIAPGLHKKQYGKTKEDTEMSELDRLAEIGIGRLSSERQAGIEEQMMEGMAQDKEKMMKRMAQEEEERAVNEEFAVHQNMQNMSEKEAKEVFEEIAKTAPNGKQDEGYLAAKEATGRYVRYEGAGTGKGGFVINKSALEKAFDRKEKMAMLQHVEQKKRIGLLYNWGFIDPEDFNATQKKSAKELKELEVLDLQHKKLEKEMANITRKVDPEKKIQYEQAATGFRQAIKDENYDDAAMFADQMKELGMPMKGFNAKDLIEKRDKKIAKSTPKVLAIAKKYGLMVGGKPTLDPFYKQQTKLTEKLNFINKDAKPSDIAQLLGTTVTTQDGKSTTYGEIMERNRIPQWEVLQRRITAGGTAPQDVVLARMMGLESLSQVTKPHYYSWAKKVMHEAISRDVWGDMYDEVKTETSKEYRRRKQAALDGINNPEIQEPEPPPPTTIEGGPEGPEPGGNMPPPPDVSGPIGPEPGGGGAPPPPVQTQGQEPPPPSAETMENLQQQVEEEQIQEAFEEDVARPAEQEAAFKLWKEQNKPPKNKSQKAEYKRFTDYGIKLLEDASPERLEKMLAIFEKEKAKKKKAGGTHYYQDYNIAYINILLNK